MSGIPKLDELKSGQVLSLEISDPWEFVTENGGGPFRAKLLSTRSNATEPLFTLVLELEIPWSGADGGVRRLLATPRYRDADLAELDNRTGLPVNVIATQELNQKDVRSRGRSACNLTLAGTLKASSA